MNKALMISMKPQHAVNILNDKKTLELRTFIPKNYKGWVYVYVTKGLGKTKYHHLYNLTEYNNGKTLFSITHHNEHSLVPDGFLNGKVAFRFWFDEYERYFDISNCTNNENGYECEYDFIYALHNYKDKIKQLCLAYDEIEEYGKGKDLYAWHIKKLEIFDTPKKLSDFYVTNKGLTYKYIKEYEEYTNDTISFRLKKAPQKMQWVYAKELENEILQ